MRSFVRTVLLVLQMAAFAAGAQQVPTAPRVMQVPPSPVPPAVPVAPPPALAPVKSDELAALLKAQSAAIQQLSGQITALDARLAAVERKVK
jgi:hypothetical protein